MYILVKLLIECNLHLVKNLIKKIILVAKDDQKFS